jgi:hypothetical protein
VPGRVRIRSSRGWIPAPDRRRVSIRSSQLSKRWIAVADAGCDPNFVVMFVMTWCAVWRFTTGWSRLTTLESTPPSIPINLTTASRNFWCDSLVLKENRLTGAVHGSRNPIVTGAPLNPDDLR